MLWGRARQDREDLRLYRNLLALLPFTVDTRRAPPAAPPEPTAVVYYRPSRRTGRHLGWS